MLTYSYNKKSIDDTSRFNIIFSYKIPVYCSDLCFVSISFDPFSSQICSIINEMIDLFTLSLKPTLKRLQLSACANERKAELAIFIE